MRKERIQEREGASKARIHLGKASVEVGTCGAKAHEGRSKAREGAMMTMIRHGYTHQQSNVSRPESG